MKEAIWFFDYCYAMTGREPGELHNNTLLDLLNMFCEHKHWMYYPSYKFRLRRFKYDGA